MALATATATALGTATELATATALATAKTTPENNHLIGSMTKNNRAVFAARSLE